MHLIFSAALILLFSFLHQTKSRSIIWLFPLERQHWIKPNYGNWDQIPYKNTAIWQDLDRRGRKRGLYFLGTFGFLAYCLIQNKKRQPNKEKNMSYLFFWQLLYYQFCCDYKLCPNKTKIKITWNWAETELKVTQNWARTEPELSYNSNKIKL